MRYFVIGDDGQKYGPADVPTLQAWVNEGRLLPTQQVEAEDSGIRSAARAVNGLVFPVESTGPAGPGPGIPQGSPYGSPQSSYQNSYARGNQTTYGDDGKQDVTIAWVFLVISFFTCCMFLQIPAIIFANKAVDKGNPGGPTVRTACFVVLGLQVLILIIRGIMVYSLIKNGGGGFPPKQPAVFPSG